MRSELTRSRTPTNVLPIHVVHEQQQQQANAAGVGADLPWFDSSSSRESEMASTAERLSAAPNPFVEEREFAATSVRASAVAPPPEAVFGDAVPSEAGSSRRRRAFVWTMAVLFIAQLTVLAMGVAYRRTLSRKTPDHSQLALRELAAIYPAEGASEGGGPERRLAEAILYRFYDAAPERLERALAAEATPSAYATMARALVHPVAQRTEDVEDPLASGDPLRLWLLARAQRRLLDPQAPATYARLLGSPKLPDYLLAEVLLYQLPRGSSEELGPIVARLLAEPTPWSELARVVRALPTGAVEPIDPASPPVVRFACHFAVALHALDMGDEHRAYTRLVEGVGAVGLAPLWLIHVAEELLDLEHTASVKHLLIGLSWPTTPPARAIEAAMFAREERFDEARAILIDLWAAGYRDARTERLWIEILHRAPNASGMPLDLLELLQARGPSGDPYTDHFLSLAYADAVLASGDYAKARELLVDRVHWLRRQAPALRATAYYVLAAAKYGLGDIAGASDDASRALRYDPRHKRARALQKSLRSAR